MFKRLLKADRYYYKNNTKAVNRLVANYGMNKVPLEQIDIIGCQESLNINVFLCVSLMCMKIMDGKIIQLSLILMDYIYWHI